MIAFRIARKLTFLNFFLIAAKGLECIGLEVGIGFDKLRYELIEKTEKIIEHKDLTVTVGACPDSNGRNGQLFRDGLG